MHVADEDEKQHGCSCDVYRQFVVGFSLDVSDCLQSLSETLKIF